MAWAGKKRQADWQAGRRASRQAGKIRNDPEHKERQLVQTWNQNTHYLLLNWGGLKQRSDDEWMEGRNAVELMSWWKADVQAEQVKWRGCNQEGARRLPGRMQRPSHTHTRRKTRPCSGIQPRCIFWTYPDCIKIVFRKSCHPKKRQEIFSQTGSKPRLEVVWNAIPSEYPSVFWVTLNVTNNDKVKSRLRGNASEPLSRIRAVMSSVLSGA